MKNIIIKSSCILALIMIFYQAGLVEMYGDTWKYCATPITKMMLCLAWILLVEFANGLF